MASVSPDRPGDQDDSHHEMGRWLPRLTLMVLVLGVLCRLVRYLLLFPLWGDEAALVVNLLDRDFAGLTRQLEGNQVAPLFFLWSVHAISLVLGSSEGALRLLPLLAGLLSLFLFWRLARLVLSPRGVLAAVGLLALARWPVTMACTVKPYSFDLLAALALLLSATHFLRSPQQLRWLIGLILLTPLALLCSWPAVFVAGGVSLALAGPVRHSSRRTWILFAVFHLVIAATFLVNWLLVARAQLDAETGSVQGFMLNYWADGFPPGHPLALLRWLALIHTGRMMAYPVGDANGGSIVTFLLFLVGAARVAVCANGKPQGACAREAAVASECSRAISSSHVGPFLLLWLAPFGLNLLAAALHRYPYGGCCRLSQHLAPAICLLAGAGLARLANYLSPLRRWQATRVWFGVLALVGAGQMIVDFAQPYRDVETRWMAQTAQTILSRVGSEDRIVVNQRRDQAESMFRYHLGRQGRVEWGGRITRQSPLSTGTSPLPTPHSPLSAIWYVDLWVEPEPHRGMVPPEPAGTDLAPGWVVREKSLYDLPPTRAGHPYRRCTLFRLSAE